MKTTKFYYFSNFKASIYNFIRYLYKILSKHFFCRSYWIWAAILNWPRMPIWHHPDFKSEYPYELISARTFSIDAIARSSWVHVGLIRNPGYFVFANTSMLLCWKYCMFMGRKCLRKRNNLDS